MEKRQPVITQRFSALYRLKDFSLLHFSGRSQDLFEVFCKSPAALWHCHSSRILTQGPTGHEEQGRHVCGGSGLRTHGRPGVRWPCCLLTGVSGACTDTET